MGGDPINHRLVMHTEEAGNAPEIETVHVHFEGLRANVCAIAERFSDWRVAVTAGTAAHPLAARTREAILNLIACLLALRTDIHGLTI